MKKIVLEVEVDDMTEFTLRRSLGELMRNYPRHLAYKTSVFNEDGELIAFESVAKVIREH